MKKIEKGNEIIVRSCSRLKECKKPCLGFLSTITKVDGEKITFNCQYDKPLKVTKRTCYIISGKDRFLLL